MTPARAPRTPADTLACALSHVWQRVAGYSYRECTRRFPVATREEACCAMKVRLLLGLQLLLLGALGVGGVTIAPLRKRVALGVLRKLVDLEKVDARQG